MKKIINEPGRFVDEMIEGILLAHPDQVKTPGSDPRIMVRADAPVAGKVGIVTGGGSGHLPLFKGYVGVGLCSGVAIGNVFSSPSSQQVFEATKAVDGGVGDVRRRREVRLPDLQVDHMLPGGLQCLRASQHLERRLGPQPPHPLRKPNFGHIPHARFPGFPGHA